MKTRTEWVERADGQPGKAEIATVSFQGKDFTAMGAVVDETAGEIVGYVQVSRFVAGELRAYRLSAFDGTEVCPILTLVSTWMHLAWGRSTQMYAWRLVHTDGRVYTGRNAGPGMLLRLRARKGA